MRLTVRLKWTITRTIEVDVDDYDAAELEAGAAAQDTEDELNALKTDVSVTSEEAEIEDA